MVWNGQQQRLYLRGVQMVAGYLTILYQLQRLFLNWQAWRTFPLTHLDKKDYNFCNSLIINLLRRIHFIELRRLNGCRTYTRCSKNDHILKLLPCNNKRLGWIYAPQCMMRASSHQGMARPQVAGGGTTSRYREYLRIYWIISRGQTKRGCPPAWGLGEVVTTPHRKNLNILRNGYLSLGFGLNHRLDLSNEA